MPSTRRGIKPRKPIFTSILSMNIATTIERKEHVIGRRSHGRRKSEGAKWYQKEPIPVSATPRKNNW
jgi:hypothetical protein